MVARIVIREFTTSDQNIARAIVLEGLGEHFGFIDESMNPDLRSISDSYLAHGHVFLVAELDGDVVGTAGLRFDGADHARIVRMSVCRAYRRRGVAQSLLARVIQVAKLRALSELVVATQPEWPDAMGFYRAAGFVVHGRDDVDVHMRLPLRAG